MEDKREKSLLWLSPLVAGIVLTLVYKAAHIFPGDTHIFLDGDYLGQFMNYIVMFWRKLFSGNGLFYSFDLGLGAPTWEHYAFYGLSPFNIVFVIIKDADTAAYVLYLMKVCAAAFCMHLFLKYSLKICNSATVLFSVSYALCSYSFNYHYGILFIDYLYLLPLVMLMMVRFFRTGKAVGLALAYAFSFLTAYYGGYMIGIFSFVCFAVMLLSGKYSYSKKKLTVLYIAAVAIAVILSAVVTIPTAAAILAGKSGDSGQTTNLSGLIWKLFADLYPLRKVTINVMEPSIYCGLPAFVFATAYFCDKRIELRKKITAGIPLIFLLICMLFKPAYLLMHGFDEPDGYYFRFAFLFCFYLIVIAAKWTEDMQKKGIILPFVIVGGIEVLLTLLQHFIFQNTADGSDIVISLAVLMFMALYFLGIWKAVKLRYVIIGVILCLEVFANGFYSITPDSIGLIRWKESYDLWNRHGEAALDRISEMENAETTPFYRVNFRDGMWTNDAMYFGFHGLGYFSSMENKDTGKLLHDLGYATAKRVVAEKGGSPFTEMIFSQKYRVSADPDIRSENCENVDVTENEYALPLAFMVSEDICDYQTVNDAFENQQRLIDAMLGHQNTIWDKYDGELYADLENAEIEKRDGKYVIKRKEAGTGLVILSIDAEKEGDYYSYLATEDSGIRQGAPVTFSDRERDTLGLVQHSTLYMPAILLLGKNNAVSSVYIMLNQDEMDEAGFEEAYFARFMNEGIKAAYDELSPGGLKISEIRDDSITGSVDVRSGKNILYTSIPYDESWHIEVDGNKTETISVLNGAFLGCRLAEGRHEIKLYYDSIYIKTGAIISFAGVLIIAIIIVCSRLRVGRKREIQNVGITENKLEKNGG